MRTRSTALVLFTLLVSPAASFAGSIEFTLSVLNITTSPWAPALGMALVPPSASATAHDEDVLPQPARLDVVEYRPHLLPTPDPIHIHPDGTTHWNNDGFFGVDLKLTDTASGESALLHFAGRAHMYNSYSSDTGWSGVTYFWFQDYAHLELGGNEYTLWGGNHYETGPACVNVWAGPNAPPVNTPEPGTFLLGALAMAPLGLWRLRR